MAPGQVVGTTLPYASVANLIVFVIYARRGQVRFRIIEPMRSAASPASVLGGLLRLGSGYLIGHARRTTLMRGIS